MFSGASNEIASLRRGSVLLGGLRAKLVYAGEIPMRTPFTGVGTALVTPFTRSGALDESCSAAARPPADSTPASIFSARAGPRVRTRR